MMSPNPPILNNERELFAQMATGSEAAFTDIFFFYIPLLQPHIQQMTKSEEATQDIIHEVFLKIWVNREKMQAVDNYRAYIFTISTNKTYDYLKKLARDKSFRSSEELLRRSGTENSTEETIDFNQSAAIINQAVAQMPPQRKLVFQLSREEGLSHEEIAARLQISKNTVSNHLTEALRSIKEYLQKMPGSSAPSILAIVIASRILQS